MIGISKLYLGTVEPSDPLRYGRQAKQLPSHLLQFSADKKPVVVWNVTPACNLKCRHCYAVTADTTSDMLDHTAGLKLIDDLADFGCPVLLFSGGEPMTRKDLPDLIAHAVGRGMRAVISTNGMLLTPELAARYKELGLSYVGISIDGLRETHDRFRRQAGAFDAAIAAVRLCRSIGLKVGLRFTIFKENAPDIPGIFQLMRDENVPRVCFYHLVYSGRGAELASEDLDHATTRKVVDQITEGAADLQRQGLPTEVLTVDNHCDGPYLYLRMLRENNPRAAGVLDLLKMNGGNSTGVGIGCVSWDGTVYPDQFWRNQPLGNVREKPFSQIWSDRTHPLLGKLKEKKQHVTGRCARCKFLDICGGNFRARAEAATGDLWAPDPACYLTDEEIGLA
ncbi:MAG: radical SAM protein [Kiritimatiellaeota bacterium]|nr:radical SAM protein [Kiritimatiellota bacterium]